MNYKIYIESEVRFYYCLHTEAGILPIDRYLKGISLKDVQGFLRINYVTSISTNFLTHLMW